MAFEFSLQTAIAGTLASSVVLSATLFYLWRIDTAQRALLYWALAFATQSLRMLAQLGAAMGHPALLALADICFALVVLLIWQGYCALEGWRSRTAGIATILALSLAWLSFGIVQEMTFATRTLPLYLVAGGIMIRAGWALISLARRFPGIGYRPLGILFALLGLHYWDYPFLRPIPALAPYGFALASLLMLGIGIGMLLTTQRKQQLAAEDLANRLQKEITDRAAAENLHRDIVAELDEGILLVAADGRVVTANSAAASILGLRLEALLVTRLQDHDFSLFDSESRALDLDRYPLRRALKHGEALRGEIVGFKPDNRTTVWLSVNVQPRHGDDGTPVAAILSMTDITARVEASRLLKESSERFAALAESSELGVVVTDESGRFTYCNQRYLTHIGCTLEEGLSGRWISHLHPDDIEPMQARWTKAIATHTGFVAERRVVASDGSLRWGRAHVVPVQGANGEFRGFVATLEDITNQRNIEIALRRSEEEFRAIFDQSFQFIGLLDTKGVLLKANQTALRFGNIDAESVIGKPFADTPWWHDPKSREQLLNAIPVAASGRLVRFETTHPGPEGRCHYVDFSLKPVFDDDGQVRLLIPEGRDITPLKEAEAALRLSEAMFSGAFHASLDYITISDLDTGRLLDVNDAFERMTGWTRAEAIGRTSMELGIWLSRESRQMAIDILRNEGFLKEYPFQCGTRSGEHRDCLLNASIISAGKKQYLLGVLRDISEQKRAADALRASEEMFTSVFRASPLPLCITAVSDGRFVDINQAWEETFGFSRAEVIGRTSNEFALWVDPEDRARLYQAVGDKRELDRYECRYRRKDGHEIYCLSSGKVFNLAGQDCFIWSQVDITLRREAQQKIINLNAELEHRVQERTEALKRTHEELMRSEKLAALGSLVAGVAHELNTPIGNAVTVASTLQEKTEDFLDHARQGKILRSSLNAYMESAKTASDLLLRGLTQARSLVTSFKQVAVDQTSDQRRRFDLHEVIDEVLTTLSPTLRKTPYKVVVEIPDGILLDSYPGPLGQVVTNFVTNALTHAFEGRSSGHLTLTATPTDDGWVQLRIADDGIGIPEENLRRIFDPFFTTKLGRGGSGLGLNIVYNIVTRILGGRISVDSRTGSGTTFLLTMPLKAPENSSTESDPPRL